MGYDQKQNGQEQARPVDHNRADFATGQGKKSCRSRPTHRSAESSKFAQKWSHRLSLFQVRLDKYYNEISDFQSLVGLSVIYL
jgi:hypothetical protein